MPPSAVYESCIELTAPVEVSVVDVANSVEPTMPNRCSLPSIAPPASSGAVPAPCELERASARRARRRRASPWRRGSRSPGGCRRPCGRRCAAARTGSRASAGSRTGSSSAVGFSNGCAEFALKNPPPLVPSCLIASCEATGPPGRLWVPPVSVVTSVKPVKFWMTPPTISTIAPTTRERQQDAGTMPRVRSTQKLPIVPDLRRAKPRTSAMATAMPTAAETKFCTARPASCTV